MEPTDKLTTASDIISEEILSDSETAAPKSSELDNSKSSNKVISETSTQNGIIEFNSFDTTLTASNNTPKQNFSLVSDDQQSNREKISNYKSASVLVDSDSEDEIYTKKQNKNKTRKHRATLVLSDSDDSETEANNKQEEQSDNGNPAKQPENNKIIPILDSDSDSDHMELSKSLNNDKYNVKEQFNNENPTEPPKKHKRIAIADSDSDSDQMEHSKSPIDDTNKSNSENPKEPPKNHKRIARTTELSQTELEKLLFDSDSDADPIENIKSPTTSDNAAVVDLTNSAEVLVLETDASKQKSKLAMLCDSESEEEPEKHNSSNEIIEQTQPEIKKPVWKSKLKKSKSNEPRKVAKVTNVKEAAKQRTEIQSESQRMLRERNTSLPYHKPKTHSLKDFLARRPKLGQPLANRAPPSVAIKMTNEQLEVISKQLQEREKELKEFYKSESESDGDNNGSDGDYVPPTEDKEKAGIGNNVESSGSTKASSNLVIIDGSPANASTSDNSEKLVNTSSSGSTKASSNLVLIDGLPANASSSDNSEKLLNASSSGSTKASSRASSNLVLIDGLPANASSSEDSGKVVASDSDSHVNDPPSDDSDKVVAPDSGSPVNVPSSECVEKVVSTGSNSSDLLYINGLPADSTSLSEKFKKSVEGNSQANIFTETLGEGAIDSSKENIQEILSKEVAEISNSKEAQQLPADSMQIDETPQIINSTEQEPVVSNVDETPCLTDSENVDAEQHPSVPDLNSMEIDETPQITDSDRAEMEHQPPNSSKFVYTDLDREIENFGNTEVNPPAQPDKETESSKFVYTDLDREIENFGNTEEEPPANSYKSELQLLKEQLANERPRLRGGPNEVIDLDLNVSKPQEVVHLMERFAKHAQAKKHHHQQHKVKLSIVRVESGGDIHKEEVAMNVHSDEETTMEEKPGVKFKKLKQELQKQMEQKKTQLWQQRASKGIRGGLEDAENEEETEKDILDFDEEEEAIMTDEEEEEEIDEELIEDDMDMTDNPKKKSAFLDEEAEISETEEDGASAKDGYESNTEYVSDNEKDEDDTEEIDNQENEDSNTPSETEQDLGQKRPLKRIIKPADDSDDEDLFSESLLQKSPSHAQLDSTITADEDEIPPHQPPRQFRTPMRPEPSQTKSIIDFLTPISFITSIQNLNSASKHVSPFRMPLDLQTPDKEQKMRQKKLFTDSDILESVESQECISQTQTEDSLAVLLDEPTVSVQDTPDIPPSTQELAEVCSGAFSGLEMASTQFVAQSSDLTSLGEENELISQLLDEEESEFGIDPSIATASQEEESEFGIDSSLAIASQTIEAEEPTGGGVIDSDDEGEELHQKKKKTNKQLQFSDDESSDEEVEDDEEIDLQDNEGLDEDTENIAYDSEENEIDLNDQPKKIKIADFVDAEAELSESEWGSEDEDEKGLDDLEFELGDTEKFDDEKVKSDLERIHMRRMLDQDTREVKLLQEILLEDGEMHGSGRQRQFKWKNIDLADDPNEEKKDDDDVYLDEEVNEEQWRKKRHEREMLLKKLQEKSQILSEDESGSGSQLLELGRKFLQTSGESQNSTPSEKAPVDPASPFKLTPFNLQSKRGSFLNRSDQVLKRVAEYTKVAISTDSKKTTKHFLFQSSSAMESSNEQNKKRKASEGTPNALKKLRLTTNFSPAIKKKMDKSERSRKLFNF